MKGTICLDDIQIYQYYLQHLHHYFIVAFTYMQSNHAWKSFIFPFSSFEISWRQLKLTLKRSFNTAHSSTSCRTNFLIKVSQQQIAGYGECGLPPKKIGCYLADVQDCEEYINIIRKQVQSMQNGQFSRQKITEMKSYIFQGIEQEKYFKIMRNYPQQNHHSLEPNIHQKIIVLLMLAKRCCKPQYKACRSAFQFALFSFYANLKQTTIRDIIFSDLSEVTENKKQNHNNNETIEKSKNDMEYNLHCYSFYTLSHESHSLMVENAMKCLEFTCQIKVKYSNDVLELINLLIELQKCQSSSGNRIQHYIIDANACWSIKDIKYFLDRMEAPALSCLKSKILYIEQPYPISMSQQEFNQWSHVKSTSPIQIIADQSFSNHQDIPHIFPISHGVNIKMEKAGGPIQALKAALAARSEQLDVMFGSMVSTHLGCTQVFQFFPLSEWMDIDGSLLVETPTLAGGFGWNGPKHLTLSKISYGNQIDVSLLD